VKNILYFSIITVFIVTRSFRSIHVYY